MQHIVAHILREPELASYRVAIIGDLHIAPWRSTRPLARSMDIINASAPDLVALVGDYGHSASSVPAFSRACYRAILPRVAGELSRLRARHGVCAVLGNHDLDAGAEMVEHALSGAGIRVLRDSHHDISHHGACLRVLGLDDITRHDVGPGVLRDKLLRGPAATLVLSHHPDLALRSGPLAPASPVLIVAGHTHGGQIAFPWLGAPVTLSRVATHDFPAGFVPNENTALYITRGLGEQVPLRVRAPREITLLELAVR
ncbi:MAG: metallophosphoesterase [Gemmatimonadaceae bacterium]